MTIKPLFVCGPSGVGKSYLTRQLCSKYNAAKIVTTTTRAIRHGEEQGVDYHFVSHEEYVQLESSKQFVVTDTVFAQRYGLLKGVVEEIISRNQVPVGEVYSPNIELFREAFPQSFAIFLFPKSLEVIRERIGKRGDRRQDIEARLASIQDELEIFQRRTYRFFDKTYIIDGNDLSRILNDLVVSFFN